MTKKKILVVEDDAIIRDMLRELLELEGYAVECAANGAEGIQFLKDNASDDLPGLVLLDMAMPVKDGAQFRYEQEMDPRIAKVPVVVMTADRNIEEKTIKIRGKGYIKKPFDIDHVVNMVGRYCG